MPRHERAVNQICLLERSVQRSGRDAISHPTHGHDDIANVIAFLCSEEASFVSGQVIYVDCGYQIMGM